MLPKFRHRELRAIARDSQSNVTSYQYDARGNRTLVTDALSHQTTFGYGAIRTFAATVVFHSLSGASIDFAEGHGLVNDQYGPAKR